MKAEAIVSGSFRNLAGTVITVDPSGTEVSIKDLDTKRPVVIKVNADSMVRRMPPMMAQVIAMRRAQAQGGSGGSPAAAGAPGGGAAGSGTPGGPGNWQGGGGNWQRPGGAGPGSPGGAPGGGGPGNWQGGGGGRMGNGDPQQMLERLPPMPLTELKPGDAVIVAGPTGSDPSRLTAIAVVAGVEPILTAPRQPGPESVGGSWNLDINIIP